jgi:hypothetical protein
MKSNLSNRDLVQIHQWGIRYAKGGDGAYLQNAVEYAVLAYENPTELKRLREYWEEAIRNHCADMQEYRLIMDEFDNQTTFQYMRFVRSLRK